MILLDTAAVFAIVDGEDDVHRRAVRTMRGIVERGDEIAMTNYVATELLSLTSRRLGMDVARTTQRVAIAPSQMLWTTPIEHALAVEQFLGSGRALSFVDCATMATMRARALTTIFTFDDDFARAGFTVIP